MRGKLTVAEEGYLDHEGVPTWRVFALDDGEVAPANAYGETLEDAKAMAEMIVEAYNARFHP